MHGSMNLRLCKDTDRHVKDISMYSYECVKALSLCGKHLDAIQLYRCREYVFQSCLCG